MIKTLGTVALTALMHTSAFAVDGQQSPNQPPSAVSNSCRATTYKDISEWVSVKPDLPMPLRPVGADDLLSMLIPKDDYTLIGHLSPRDQLPAQATAGMIWLSAVCEHDYQVSVDTEEKTVTVISLNWQLDEMDRNRVARGHKPLRPLVETKQ